MMKRVVIDTNILIKGFQESEPIYLKVLYLLIPPEGNDPSYYLCADFNNMIIEEYNKKLKENIAFRKWITQIHRFTIHRFDGSLNNSHRRDLAKLGCHEPTDHVFVAVAFKADKILISEDSDFGKGPRGHLPPHCDVLKYLIDTMGLSIFDANEAIRYLT